MGTGPHTGLVGGLYPGICKEKESYCIRKAGALADICRRRRSRPGDLEDRKVGPYKGVRPS